MFCFHYCFTMEILRYKCFFAIYKLTLAIYLYKDCHELLQLLTFKTP